MRNHIKSLAVAAAAVTMLSIGAQQTSAFTDCPAEPAHMKCDRHMKMLAGLNLSDQQKEQIRGIMGKHRGEMRPLFKQMRHERQELRALIHADTVNERAIRAQSAKVASLEADTAVQRARIGQEIRRVMTPEQVQKFKELQQKRENNFHNFRHHGHHEEGMNK